MFDRRTRAKVEGGVVERIGEPGARLVHVRHEGNEDPVVSASTADVGDHRGALDLIVATLGLPSDGTGRGLYGIGHRVVHGGEVFRDPCLIDDRVVAQVRALASLAPLHNPPNLLGIEVARAQWPNVPQVAVFDTAFHATIPAYAYRYAVPRAWYENHGVRRYGFHGTSHAYVAKEAARFLGRPLSELNLITLHLGNGASAAAINQGKCVDTSMGLTPLEGLVMGTRAGDIDPGAILHVAHNTNMALDEIESALNKESGLRGLCGTGDVRDALLAAEDGEDDARLALDAYVYRVRKYIGAYAAALGRVDALVFTAGVGENSAEIRARVCQGLELLGVSIDDARNRQPHREARSIDRGDQRVRVLVVPTDEELEIAEQTVQCIEGSTE